MFYKLLQNLFHKYYNVNNSMYKRTTPIIKARKLLSTKYLPCNYFFYNNEPALIIVKLITGSYEKNCF
jgi:hypothetical protein